MTVPSRSAASNAAGRSALPADRAVDVGDPEQDELAAEDRGAQRLESSVVGLDVGVLGRLASIDLLERRREPLDHLAELLVGARVGGREQRLVTGEAVR